MKYLDSSRIFPNALRCFILKFVLVLMGIINFFNEFNVPLI